MSEIGVLWGQIYMQLGSVARAVNDVINFMLNIHNSAPDFWLFGKANQYMPGIILELTSEKAVLGLLSYTKAMW